jgi:hypothetical protein
MMHTRESLNWNQLTWVFTILSLLVVPLAWSQNGNAEQQVKEMSDQQMALVVNPVNTVGVHGRRATGPVGYAEALGNLVYLRKEGTYASGCDLLVAEWGCFLDYCGCIRIPPLSCLVE